MSSELKELLKLKYEPVAIIHTDEKPENSAQFKVGGRGCVALMLVASAKGRVIAFDRDTYGCPGGGVGLGFGDTYGEFPIECFLSTGDDALKKLNKTSPRKFGEGERFFAEPEYMMQVRKLIPYVDIDKKYVVFSPLSKVDENTKPVSVCVFINADQLSALKHLAGFRSGQIDNVRIPFGAACQHILFSYEESKKEHPKAVLGFFDLTKRHGVNKDLISFTAPYSMWEQMEKDAPDSFLRLEYWNNIKKRIV